MKYVTRKEWGAKPSKYALVYIASTKGVKVHWEGAAVPASLGDPSNHNKCDDRMRAIQTSHMANTKEKYSDIAYNFAVCPHGTVYEGRGLHRQTGANGSQVLNKAHYSVLAFLGNSGLTEPSDAQLNGICDAIALCRSEGKAASEVKGHRDGHPTQCPGEKLYAWVKKGALRPIGSTPTVPANPPTSPHPPRGARGSLGSWPGSPPITFGRENGSIQKLQLRLRSAIGPEKSRQLNPNGASGYYGYETKAMVKFALRGNPETWSQGAHAHDGIVGPKSWHVIDKL